MSDLRYLEFVVSQVQCNDHPHLGLTLGKNSASMNLATFDVLDFNLLIPFRYIYPSNINIDVMNIYPSLNTSKVRLHLLSVFQELNIFPSKINIDVRDIYPSLNAISKITLQTLLFIKKQDL
jgi:hypothetical protein